MFSRFQLFQQIVSEEQEAIGHIDIAHATVKIQAQIAELREEFAQTRCRLTTCVMP